MNKIPTQLKREEFRFYLIPRNSKIPQQKRWNNDVNYKYNDPILKRHINNHGNYGVCTGFGNLIVIDFDHKDYYNSIVPMLKPTFTVQTAKKRLFHMYYILDEKEMFKKVPIDWIQPKGGSIIIKSQKKIKKIRKSMSREKFLQYYDTFRVADIQAVKSGVVAPNSTVDRKFYDVVNPTDIAHITIKELEGTLGIKIDNNGLNHGSCKPVESNIEEVRRVQDRFQELGVKKGKGKNYICPFHDSSGFNNLSIMSSGKIYCFHECQTWHSVEQFEKELRGK